jgi:hypothetical protein
MLDLLYVLMTAGFFATAAGILGICSTACSGLSGSDRTLNGWLQIAGFSVTVLLDSVNCMTSLTIEGGRTQPRGRSLVCYPNLCRGA